MRLKNIILNDLTNDQLKVTEQIERLINSNDNDLQPQCTGIRGHLRELVMTNLMIEAWVQITQKEKDKF
jgi:hypothetical protein